MSVGQEFWIVAAGCKKDAEKNDFMRELKDSPTLGCGAKVENPPWAFNVPDGQKSLTFGSFDNLIRLTDDLQKYDSSVESMVHRLERQFLELDPAAVFQVKSQRVERTVEDYMRTWQWDEAKYPRSRPLTDNITLLMAVVGKLDEESRNKTAQYNEFKTLKTNISRKEGIALSSRDLVDVLTPDVVKTGAGATDDYVHTENLTTVIVIISRGQETTFVQSYEGMTATVVPRSAKKFEGIDDKDGNSMWRVVVMKSGVEEFRKQCRERKIIVRDWEYSMEAFEKLQKQREDTDESLKRAVENLKGLYRAAWSDMMVAWFHLKAMRLFVESVLRFGLPAGGGGPKFAAFIVSPPANRIPIARKALNGILGKGTTSTMADAPAEEGGEEFFSYVSFSITPFVVPR